MRLNQTLYFWIVYFLTYASCAYIPVQDDENLPSKLMQNQDEIYGITLHFDLDDTSSSNNIIIPRVENTNRQFRKHTSINPWQKMKHKYRQATQEDKLTIQIAPICQSCVESELHKLYILRKRSPKPIFLKLAKMLRKAVPKSIQAGKEISNTIKNKQKRSLQEDKDADFAPILEKRVRGFNWGKALGHLNNAGTVAMVGSAGLAAHGAVKEGWNQKKNAAAAGGAPPARKRDLDIDISNDAGKEVIIIKRGGKGQNKGRAKGQKSKTASTARVVHQQQQQQQPGMSRTDKLMTGMGAVMSGTMIYGFATEAKNAVSGTPPAAKKREETGEKVILVKRAGKFGALKGLTKLLGKSKSAPARSGGGGGNRSKPALKPAPKPASKPAGKPAGKPGGSGGGIGDKIGNVAGAAMSVGSVVSLAGEAKAMVSKPPAEAPPPARKRSIEEFTTSNNSAIIAKRAPRPPKVGNKTRTSPYSRSNPKPKVQPKAHAAQQASSSGGGGLGRGLEMAGTASMLAGMATPALVPAASAAHNAWDSVKSKFTGKKAQ